MNSFIPKFSRARQGGFTLVEMLVSVTILVMVMVLATQMIGATSKIWKNTTSKIEAFQGARDGFQLMTDELRQATLNTYWDYYDSAGRPRQFSQLNPFIPSAYGRQSELHFVSGPGLPGTPMDYGDAVLFQAPLGYTATPSLYGQLQNLLNGTGFFIEYSDGTNYVNSPPVFLPVSTPIYRYRLAQFIQPTEQMRVYRYSLTSNTRAYDWYNTPLQNPTSTTTSSHGNSVRIAANNIIGLIILPKATDSPTDTLAPNYSYDSRLGLSSGASTAGQWTPGVTSQPLQMNQMPPLLRVAMVAIDEPSAALLQSTQADPTTSNPSIETAFQQSNPNGSSPLFSDGQYMDSDLLYLQNGPDGLAAIKPHLNFRVFETTVSVKSARFSTQ